MEIQTIKRLFTFRQRSRRNMRVARCIPPEQVGLDLASGKNSRFGDLLRHIAVTGTLYVGRKYKGGNPAIQNPRQDWPTLRTTVRA